MGEQRNHLTLPSDPITKKSLASFLEVSERSVYNYSQTASQYVDDFLADYPSVEGRYLTSMPLSSYQAWVLIQVHEFLSIFASSRLLQDRLERDIKIQKSFSKQAFLAKFPEYSEAVASLQP